MVHEQPDNDQRLAVLNMVLANLKQDRSKVSHHAHALNESLHGLLIKVYNIRLLGLD